MTNGGDPGANRPVRAAWAIAVAGPILFAGINIWSRLHDQPALLAAGRAWEVAVWEASSAIMTILLLPLVARLADVDAWQAKLSDGAKGAAQVGAILCAAALAFYMVHVAGFLVLRKAAYAAAGSQYRFGGVDAWLYELPKDILTFAIALTIFGLGRVLAVRRSPAADRVLPSAITIRDGRSTYLLAPHEIRAAAAAGNYVEYYLADERRILVRGRLSDAAAGLAEHGFIRTHRSWIANPAHIREVHALGNGEQLLRMGGELTIPVARRQADELRRLLGR